MSFDCAQQRAEISVINVYNFACELILVVTAMCVALIMWSVVHVVVIIVMPFIIMHQFHCCV